MKVAASAFDVVRRPAPGLVVLIYHRVGGRTPVEVDIPSDLFDRQMSYLAEHCHVVSLDEGLRMLRTETESARRMVAVTFDDGTADFADLAVPIMVRHSIPATLYAATNFIETGTAFPDDGAPLSWAALRDACASGAVSVGSHTHTHALLDRVSARDAESELDRSIGAIESNLGTAPRHFAYPKAVLGSEFAEEAVKARFASAALAGTRANRPGRTDAYRLARSPIQRSDGMRWFKSKAHGGLALEDSLRRVINRRRYGALDY